MTEKNQIYKCEICGIISSIIHPWAGEMSCCGQAMKLITENTEEAATEKHIPVIKKLEDGVQVMVGTVEHPMIDTHLIEWIEVRTISKTYRQELKPWDTPKVFFNIVDENIISARAYCNLHGLWKNE